MARLQGIAFSIMCCVVVLIAFTAERYWARPTPRAAIRAYLRRRRIRATIPEKADQIAARHRRGTGGRPPSFDPEVYKDRNVVERAINKLRATRAVGTRYDKRDFVYRGTIDVASIRIWLRDPVLTHPRDTA